MYTIDSFSDQFPTASSSSCFPEDPVLHKAVLELLAQGCFNLFKMSEEIVCSGGKFLTFLHLWSSLRSRRDERKI